MWKNAHVELPVESLDKLQVRHFWIPSSKTDDHTMFGTLHELLGGGLKYFLFSPLLGEDSHFD